MASAEVGSPAELEAGNQKPESGIWNSEQRAEARSDPERETRIVDVNIEQGYMESLDWDQE